MKRMLLLTLSALPFEVMASGEKPDEFRKDKQWIRSRLLFPNGTRKEYDVVKFINGTVMTNLFFIAKYNGFSYAKENTTLTYSNGLEVEVEAGDVIIHLGEIIKTGNIKKP